MWGSCGERLFPGLEGSFCSIVGVSMDIRQELRPLRSFLLLTWKSQYLLSDMGRWALSPAAVAVLETGSSRVTQRGERVKLQSFRTCFRNLLRITDVSGSAPGNTCLRDTWRERWASHKSGWLCLGWLWTPSAVFALSVKSSL